jgi:diguanylate cyclase (GGDEF)-like protein
MIIILSAVLVWRWHELLVLINDANQMAALLTVLPIVPYIILFVGFFMGWRYNNAGLMLASIALLLAYLAVTVIPDSNPAQENNPISVARAIAFLLPMNLASFAMMTKRRVFTTVGVVSLVLVFVQCFTVLILCYPHGNLSSQLIARINYRLPWLANNFSDSSLWVSSVLSYNYLIKFDNLATPSIVSFSLALVFVLVYFIHTRDIRIGGFFLALVALLLGFAAYDNTFALSFYSIAGGLVLIVTTVEASFSMAYIDELTGLPGRRSLNDTLINLGKKYAIAMIDVDHFKKFNDTYGHKTGDHVLKMIAAKLERISGGAKTFRYGGEEFTAIFPGKDAEESISHVEQLRQTIESTPFVVRGKDRRRGRADRRGKGKASDQKGVKVTVSIGVASPQADLTDPEKVLKAADKSLYKAKRGGRNSVVCDSL